LPLRPSSTAMVVSFLSVTYCRLTAAIAEFVTPECRRPAVRRWAPIAPNSCIAHAVNEIAICPSSAPTERHNWLSAFITFAPGCCIGAACYHSSLSKPALVLAAAPTSEIGSRAACPVVSHGNFGTASCKRFQHATTAGYAETLDREAIPGSSPPCSRRSPAST